MKKVHVQKQVIGWEEYTHEVPDDFKDYKSLVNDDNWIDWEYLVDASENTGEYEIFDENYDKINENSSN